MKKIFLFGTMMAALTLASCSSSDDSQQTAGSGGQERPVAVTRTPVGFDAYTGRSVTRAGLAGDLTDTQLKLEQANNGGFGVFAYYTDLKKYDQTYVPNFMYNQGVFWNETTGAWEYSPVMYWPNEYGSNAQSDDEDKVTFFAYAPYVAHESAAAGRVDTSTDPTAATWGITGFSSNSTAGDPLVRYIVSFDPAKTVDLCWGVVGTEQANDWQLIQTNAAQTGLTAGKPWLDVEHPKGISQKLKFTFNHALSQLNVQVDADVDVTEHDGANEGTLTASETKIYVRSISFTGLATQGSLNLNNSTANQALWLDYGGTTDLPYGQSVTINDGRRDGREGAENAAADNELPQGLNPAVVQNTGSTTTGVTTALQNLFNPGDTGSDEQKLARPVYVIPTGEAMTVTIVYDVETWNQDLPGYISDGTTHGLSVENRISKTVNFGGAGMVSGKKYTLKLHLGMNSVKFDAIVSDWDNTDNTENAWLPSN